MKEEINILYKGIRDNIELSRMPFVKTSLAQDENDLSVNSLEHAKILLDTYETIALFWWDIVSEFPSLESIFELKFGPQKDLYDRELIIETIFIEDYLFPIQEEYPLKLDGEMSLDLIHSYSDTFIAWAEDIKNRHTTTQVQIKDRFDFKLSNKDLLCQCVQCLGDYRTKVRDYIYEIQIKKIDQTEEKLQDDVLVKDISSITIQVFDLRKSLDKVFNQSRYKLKRSSLNKLENEVKSYFKNKFGVNSSLGLVFKERLKVFFNTLLVESGLKPEIITPDEFEKFYQLLETNIWRNQSYLKNEFDKFIKSVLAFKRKDISANILKEYLGQFWLHTEARKIKRKIIYHMGPTNSGKTYHAIEALCAAQTGCYLAPLRLLASELFDTMNNKGVKTTLLTGEEVVEVPGSSHFSSTIEMAKLTQRFDCCVIDEIQMLSDPQRGWAWTRALINIQADVVHLCGDHSVFELVKRILVLTGDELEVKKYERMTELKVMDQPITLSSLEKGDALIVFSRRNALKYKADLENLDFKVSIVYGRLSPEVRREQARKFDEEETDIIVSTDAIAMGMNLPVQRIIFSALSKFINEKEYKLTPSEIKQISGRAGRFGRFPVGYVTTLTRVEGGIQTLNEAISYDLKQQDRAMVGPDLDIFNSVNQALSMNSLHILSLSEFLRLFNTMIFQKPFYCVDLKEMIELAEMVESSDEHQKLSSAELFGFACAPVNLGLLEHVQYYLWILNHYVNAQAIYNEPIDDSSDDIDYLETSIKCVELYQWLARHFDQKYFEFEDKELLENKMLAVEKLNSLLSEKTSKTCSSCGCKMAANSRFNICDNCFQERRARFRSKPQINSNQEDKPKGNKRNFKGASKKNSNKPANAYKKFR